LMDGEIEILDRNHFSNIWVRRHILQLKRDTKVIQQS
jgi:IS1 family transposase